MDLIDESGKVCGNVVESLVFHEIDCFDLEGLHETLSHSVLVRVATPAHRADQPMFGEQLAIVCRCVLGSAIRMVDTAPWRLS